MRKFDYLTCGVILEELAQEGLKLSRPAFLRLEKRLNLPVAKRTSGILKWRVYTRDEVNSIKDKIKKEYNFENKQ